MPAFDALIVGAGTCGLATAVALAQKGHRVRILEESGTFNDFGGSITILPSATRLFAAWGLQDEFKKYVTPIRCFKSKDGETGEVLGHAPCNIGNIAQISFDAEYEFLINGVKCIQSNYFAQILEHSPRGLSAAACQGRGQVQRRDHF